MPQERLRVIRTLERTFLLSRDTGRAMIPLALLMVTLPTILYGYLKGGTFGAISGDAIAAVGIGQLGVEYLFQAVAIRYALTSLRGGTIRPDADAAATLRLALPILGAVILSYVIVMLGLVLLIVPGIIAFVMTFILVPVLVEERRGVWGSLKRSLALSRGAGWRIFAILLLALTFLAALALLLFLLEVPQAVSEVGPEFWLFASATLRGGFSLLLANLLALIYVELVEVREGSRSLTTVFA